MIERRFATETEDVIQQRKLGRVSDDLDKRQGSIIYDTLAPNSFEEAQLYIALDDVIQFGLNVTEDTPDEFVDLKTKALGVIRKQALQAVGEVVFTGDEGTVIPIGTRVRTDSADPVYFVTTMEGIIANGQSTVRAIAEVGGTNGNVSPNQVNVVLGDLSGLMTVTNPNPFIGGVDRETNEALLTRYYEKVQRPATSGNAYQYEQWAKSVPGVGDAKVTEVAFGPGTVKVVLLSDQKTAPDQTVIQATVDYIETVRPVGATPTIIGATEIPINVSATLTLASGATLEEIQSQFETGLKQYLQSIAFKDELIRYTRIANVLLDIPPIIDYENLLVNGGTSNIQTTQDEVGVLGTVTFT